MLGRMWPQAQASNGRASGLAFHAQDALLASIVDSSDDAIMAKSPDGIITIWNRGAELLYGYSAEEIIGKPVQILIHADRQQEMDAIIDRIRHGERVEHYETERVRKDGRAIAISLTVSPILDAAGALVGVSSIARDISERKRLEVLEREASTYARNLIEASLDPLLTISVEGKITDANEAMLKVTGVPREQLTGTDFCDYFTEPRRARAAYMEAFSLGFVTDHSLTVRHAGGQLRDFLFNASVYKDTRGEVLGIFAAARDVTAKRNSEALLGKELERLAELERFKKLTIGRELKMIDLKREIRELMQELESLRTVAAAPRFANP